MDRQIELTSTTMNKIRFSYVEAYNHIIDKLTKTYKSETQNAELQPVMTQRVHQHLKNKISEM